MAGLSAPRANFSTTGYVMDDASIRTAVTAWFDDRAAAEAAYGHISTWKTGGVTDMSELFCSDECGSNPNAAAASFNEDISAWDTSGVTTMNWMFYRATSFNQDIGDWAVHSVTRMRWMFAFASAFDQDLGWCVGDDVSLYNAFYNTPCASTSCGVTQVDGSCAPTLAPTLSPAPTLAPTPVPTATPTAAPTLDDDDTDAAQRGGRVAVALVVVCMALLV